MDIVNKILGRVKNEVPPFNDDILLNYRRKQINNSINFINDRFSEAAAAVGNGIIPGGYRVLPPEESAKFEINNPKPALINIRNSELVLVEYLFKYNDIELSTKLYVPYAVNDCIIINNTKYNIQLALTDKIFSRSGENLISRVIRSPVKFRRITTTLVDDNNSLYITNIALSEVHNLKSARKSRKATGKAILHYLICCFGLIETLNKFKITYGKDIELLDEKPESVDLLYAYFSLKSNKLFIKISRKILKSKRKGHIALTVVYILLNFKKINKDDLINSTIVWKTLLGKIIYGISYSAPQLVMKIDKHLSSLDNYLDEVSRKRYESFGIKVNNIFEFFGYVLINMDKLLLESAPNDLYLKRVDVIEQVLIDHVISMINNKIYRQQNIANIHRDDIAKKIFNIHTKAIAGIYKSENVRTAIAGFNDNKLFNYLSKIILPSSKKKGSGASMKKLSLNSHLFHHSFIIVTSLIGHSNSNPLKNLTINPFVEINEFGGFEKNQSFSHYWEKYIEKI